MKHQLKDSSGRLVGTITFVSGDRQEGRDANGRLKGRYDGKRDRTYDSNGREVGRGNLLAAVIASTLSP